ncbi:hypothetical protein [Microbacterium sp.]|uniref:hypothetical protein n=1 Tax=Microbacterium sp. TaxID=51671 RepID=UPI0028118099|nr:hypothetical protein [Microbacterium sp.]
MSITKKDAAATRAAAAKQAEAADRLSALEVERRGYVQRGDEEGVELVDAEIARWSKLVGVPAESGRSGDGGQGTHEQDLEQANATIARKDDELAEFERHLKAVTGELDEARDRAGRLEQELTALRAEHGQAADASQGNPDDGEGAAQGDSHEAGGKPAPKNGGRAKAAAAAKG